jgi:hypothetical protein
MGSNHATTQPNKSGLPKHFAWRSGGDIPAMRSCLFSQIKRLSSRRGELDSRKSKGSVPQLANQAEQNEFKLA